jgi:flotillin
LLIYPTGAQAGGEQAGGEASLGGVNSIRNMYQMLPPLMSTIQDQTGLTMPEWQFGKLANEISEREVSGKAINGLGAKAT